MIAGEKQSGVKFRMVLMSGVWRVPRFQPLNNHLKYEEGKEAEVERLLEICG